MRRECHPNGHFDKPKHHAGSSIQEAQSGYIPQPGTTETAGTPGTQPAIPGCQIGVHEAPGLPTANPGRPHQHEGPGRSRAVL